MYSTQTAMPRMCVTDYEISPKTAFVLQDQLTKLPPYFDAWNDISSRLPELVASRALRDEILKMPVLDVSKLDGYKQICLAHGQLAFMTTCYLTQNGPDPKDVARTLPKSLAVPLHELHKQHNMYIGITYADLFLCNMTLKNEDGPVELDNITPIVHPTTGEDWLWFFGIGIMVELVFSPAVQAIQDVLDGVDDGDEKKLERALNQISNVVLEMKKTMKRFHEKLTVERFFPVMTRFFIGFEMMNPEGIVFEGVRDEPFKSKNANAGQSPTFKALDVLLGIQHASDRQEYTEQLIENELLPGHKQFIKDLQKRPKQLKDFVMASDNEDLKTSYNSAIQAIVTFRSTHVQIVTKYVIQGANKNLPEEMQETVAPFKKFTMKYVKGMRDDSKKSVVSS